MTNWLHTLILQMDSLDEISIVLFHHEKTKSYQKKLPVKKQLTKNDTTKK